MEQRDHILVVDDDAGIRGLLAEYLERSGFRVTGVADGRAMRIALERSHVDLVVLDLMLPGEDGLTLCRDLRAGGSTVPVVMLTARGDETDRIVGLEMGADDYLPKPFSPRELLARIRSVLRRARALPGVAARGGEHRLEFAGWRVDLDSRELVSPDGVAVELSGGEFRLLEVFVTHPNRVLSRDQLMDLTQGRDHYPLDRSIDVQVSRLRRRLGDAGHEPRVIKTVRGAGYVFAATVASSGP